MLEALENTLVPGRVDADDMVFDVHAIRRDFPLLAERVNIHCAAHALAARATEAINLVARSWGGQHLGAADEIIVAHLAHHANIVAWHQLAPAKGAIPRRFGVETTVRASLAFYNTFEEIDRLAIALARLARPRTTG